tara:strand:+ start:153084 stop:153230 length:147 start_codon:yes stop_codon:yes gene_type:complete
MFMIEVSIVLSGQCLGGSNAIKESRNDFGPGFQESVRNKFSELAIRIR